MYTDITVCSAVITDTFFVGEGFVKMWQLDSGHLCQDGAIAEGVANGRQPWCDVAKYGSDKGIVCGYHIQDDVDVEQDGSYSNQVVQLCTCQLQQSKMKMRNYA